jgi:hypothetical protein
MTWALCFSCGATKFGAICPCPECTVSSTGDMSLDIAFSDHHLAVETLREFGAVVRSIHRVCEDGTLCFWSFIHYVSTNHPDLLGVNLPPEQRQRCEEVIAQAAPPPVTVREVEHVCRWRDSEEGKQGSEADDAGPTDA